MRKRQAKKIVKRFVYNWRLIEYIKPTDSLYNPMQHRIFWSIPKRWCLKAIFKVMDKQYRWDFDWQRYRGRFITVDWIMYPRYGILNDAVVRVELNRN